MAKKNKKVPRYYVVGVGLKRTLLVKFTAPWIRGTFLKDHPDNFEVSESEANNAMSEFPYRRFHAIPASNDCSIFELTSQDKISEIMQNEKPTHGMPPLAALMALFSLI